MRPSSKTGPVPGNPTTSSPSSAREPGHDAIRQRAFEIYVARGRTPGHEVEDWVQAERELRRKGGHQRNGERR